MRRVRLSAAVLVTVALAACRTPPRPPDDAPGPDGQVILGTERLGWDQVAPDSMQLAAFRWAAYVDGNRVELADVVCGTTFGPDGYACAAPLPPLSAGSHTLEVASFVAVDGSLLESSRSSPLVVTVAAAGAGPGPAAGAAGESPSPAPAPSSWNGAIVPAGGAALRLAVVAEGLADPAALAFAPDGRIFVGQAGGQIRIVSGGRADDPPALALSDVDRDAGGLMGLVLDPAFDRNGFVYVLYAARDPSGSPVFRLARYRELRGTLAEAVVLLDRVPARQRAAAALLWAGDGALYVALDNGGNPRATGDLASLNGKVLRLNPDGTTPRDQDAFSPAYALPFGAPRAAAVDPASGTLWVADRGSTEPQLLAVARRRDPDVHGDLAAGYLLPPGVPPSSLALAGGSLGPAFRHNLLLASADARALLRLWIDPERPTVILGSERLLQDRAGPLRVVATSPDGTTYFATPTAIGRLELADSPEARRPDRAP